MSEQISFERMSHRLRGNGNSKGQIKLGLQFFRPTQYNIFQKLSISWTDFVIHLNFVNSLVWLVIFLTFKPTIQQIILCNVIF